MVQSLITRIRKLEQYNPAEKTILWQDTTDTRWENYYGDLKPGDNAIFIGEDRIYVGDITEVQRGKNSIKCSNIQELEIENDQFLSVNEIYPELISRVKANFQPFIHPKEIEINKFVDAVRAKRFVSFYIFKNSSIYSANKQKLKENDRVILLNGNGEFENLKTYSSAELKILPSDLNIRISVAGLTPEKILEINRQIKRKTKRSNNVNRIEKIIQALQEPGFYKFNTFFSYYDCLFNKKVYQNVGGSNSIKEIELSADENVYKVSMGPNDIDEKSFAYFSENNLLVVHSNTKAKATSSQTQGEFFSKQMKVGDYFYLCRGNSNFELIGRVLSEAEPCEYDGWGEEGWLERSYEIIGETESDQSYRGDKKWWTPNDNSTCIPIPASEIDLANELIFEPFFNRRFIQKRKTENLPNENKSMSENICLNQILFGPPGTGKTYTTIDKAIHITHPEFDLSQDREKVKDEFDRLVDEGRIAFTTFHQSMSYEDFVEGIKPIEPEKDGEPVIYRNEYGIFRRLCVEASFAIAQMDEKRLAREVLDFSIQYDNFVEAIEEKIANGEKVELETRTGGTILVDSTSQHGNINVKHEENTRTYVVSKPRLSKLQAAITNLDEVSNINEQFRTIIGGCNSTAYWAVLNEIRKKKSAKVNLNTNRTYTWEEKRDVVISLKKADYKNKNAKPFVLIIDEINRGNVSQIFGELITLIEKDKRLGKEEALEAILPYSGDKFGVPPNLHIIGTMNTADRSVEALDAALRRRFSFEELPPEPTLIKTKGKAKDGVVDEINLLDVLTTINARIEKLLDKDHLIGHSYFMKVSDLESLKAVFQNEINPLLQEYFFGDFGKIGLVIGTGFFRDGGVQAKDNENIFAEFGEYESSDLSDRPIYKLIDATKMSDTNFKDAINKLLKK